MNQSDVRIDTPCGADWSTMTPTEAKKRLCAECNKSVHDLSAMNQRDVTKLLASGPTCVRYLYDAHGRILFGAPPPNSTVVPASALLSKMAKSKWLAAAALGASALVFEACGGNDGGGGGVGYLGGFTKDAGPSDDNSSQNADDRRTAKPNVADGSVGDGGAGTADEDAAGGDGG